MEGNGSDIMVQPIRKEVENDCNNASTLEEGDQDRAKLRLGGIKGTKNPLKTTLTRRLNENADDLGKKHETKNPGVTKTLERTSVSRDMANISAAVQLPLSSVPGNSKKGRKDSRDKNELTQRSIDQRQRNSTQPPSQQQGREQNLKRKRTRQQPSAQPTHPRQTQNIDQRNIAHIWTRYDLTAIEMTTAHETAELEAVQKQFWKPKKFVPYNGRNLT